MGQLLLGLGLFGASIALLVRADLGLDPWDVFHQGVSAHTGASIGVVVIVVSAIVLVLWVPLRQRPGLGTLANAGLVGVFLSLTLAALPTPTALPWRMTFLVAGIGCNAVATGLYIGAGLGPGPRDGLMTGLAARGISIRLARGSIEVTVLAIGWALGGRVGIGTIAYALAIGPLAHIFIPLFSTAHTKKARHEAPRPDR